MFHVPDDQQIRDSIERFIASMDELERRMRCRIDDTKRWDEAHLDELAGMSATFARIRAQVRILQASNS